MASRILVVEDEREIADLILAYLERDGFIAWRVATATEASRIHDRERPDLVLLDIGLPGGDGVDLLRALRMRGDTPVIMVTARDDDATKLASLRIGADDYVVKPFNPSEVVERVRALLRRANGGAARRALGMGPLEIDLEAQVVSYAAGDGGRRRLALTPTEYALLSHMTHQPRRAFSRAELLAAVSPDSDAFDRVIDSHISNLRAKLAAHDLDRVLEPVRGVGYRLWLD